MTKVGEADVAAAVVAHLERGGFDVYQEVGVTRGVADIVVITNDESWIVEVKTAWSLDLLEQCLFRTVNAHRVYAAVPDGNAWDERSHLFRRVGIGSFRVTMPGTEKWRVCAKTKYTAKEQRAPVAGCGCWICVMPVEPAKVSPGQGSPLHRPERDVREWCRPEHKTHAKAGVKNGAGVYHWTDFRATCERLRAHVDLHPQGIVALDAVKAIDHHYADHKSARAHLVSLAGEGVVDGVRTAKVGGLWWFFPASAG